MISHDPITTEPINISDTKITKGTGNWVIFGTSQAWLHFDYLHSISLGTKCFFAIKSHQVPFLSKLHGSVENGKWKTNENERVDSKLRRLASTSRFPLQHESDPTIHLSISYFPSYPWTFQKSSVGSFAATAVMPTTLVDDKRNPKNIKQSKNRKKKKKKLSYQCNPDFQVDTLHIQHQMISVSSAVHWSSFFHLSIMVWPIPNTLWLLHMSQIMWSIRMHPWSRRKLQKTIETQQHRNTYRSIRNP